MLSAEIDIIYSIITQQNVPRPISFLVIKNSLSSVIELFADDTKLYNISNTSMICCIAQPDTIYLMEWSKNCYCLLMQKNAALLSMKCHLPIMRWRLYIGQHLPLKSLSMKTT